jgi:hypothetical protein
MTVTWRSVAVAGIGLLAASALACGGGDAGSRDEGGETSPSSQPAPAPTRLRVEVRPEGRRGGRSLRTIACRPDRAREDPRCKRLDRIEPGDFGPVGRRACIQVYGGPATARVTGTLRGRRIDADFSLTDGCEIERWRRLAVLLGEPPVRGGPLPGGQTRR